MSKKMSYAEALALLELKDDLETKIKKAYLSGLSVDSVSTVTEINKQWKRLGYKSFTDWAGLLIEERNGVKLYRFTNEHMIIKGQKVYFCFGFSGPNVFKKLADGIEPEGLFFS